MHKLHNRLRKLEGASGMSFTLVLVDDFSLDEFNRRVATCKSSTSQHGTVILLDSLNRGYLASLEYDPADIDDVIEKLNWHEREAKEFYAVI